ncbi:MAG: hypothetical protein JHC94_09425, partial [Acidimicrobiia bacterium]|nr:hypothetical protein [Acidimicrobiia bacterium]
MHADNVAGVLAGSVLRLLDPYEDLAVVRDGANTIIAIDAQETRHVSGPQALDALSSLRDGW